MHTFLEYLEWLTLEYLKDADEGGLFWGDFFGFGYNSLLFPFDDFFLFFFKQKTAYEIMPSLVGSEMCIRDRN